MFPGGFHFATERWNEEHVAILEIVIVNIDIDMVFLDILFSGLAISI